MDVDIEKLKKDVIFSNRDNALRRSVITNGILATASEPRVENPIDDVFSIDLTLDDKTETSNQNRSGRCWLYAALNTVRHDIAKKLNIEKFELSQNYLYFLDKLEKSNLFLENVIKTADKNIQKFPAKYLFDWPQADGGYWEMALALINKYGVVPANVMPETFDSKDSTALNDVLDLKLRKAGLELREMIKNKASDDKVQELKSKTIEDIYKILVISLGQLPTKFDFYYVDQDKKTKIIKNLTPIKFRDRFTDRTKYCQLVNWPANIYKYNSRYAMSYFGNVAGKSTVNFVNIKLDLLKDMIIEQLKSGKRVWFGCDVHQQSNREGILNQELYVLNDLYDQDFNMSRDDSMLSRRFNFNHAMVMCGVDLSRDGKPIKWKVENSWGKDKSHNGYYIMSDAWFDNYVCEAIIDEKFVDDDTKKIFEQEPILVNPWESFM